jgi:hypothetical protein
MPVKKVTPQMWMGKFCGILVFALLAIPVAFATDDDQQAYCKYVIEQSEAQKDLLLTPNAVAGLAQPNTGLPTQLVWGVSSSLSNIRKAGLTMEAARRNCEVYGATASAQQAIQYAIPTLEKVALEHRLGLIQHALETLDSLFASTQKMLEAQNTTRPVAFALTTTKIKLAADRADTQSKISNIYAPELNSRPVKELVAEKQDSEINERKAIDKLNRQNDWDIALAVGEHQQINPLAANKGAYGEVTVSYNLASHAINKHLDQAADAFKQWKTVQEGDVIRNAEILRQQVISGISVQDSRLQALEQEQRQVESNLEAVNAAETTAALDFRNQLTTAELLLHIEIGDASFRLGLLKEYLRKNF